MHIKMMYNTATFKNVFQYQMSKFNNAKPQLLLHQSNTTNQKNSGKVTKRKEMPVHMSYQPPRMPT